ncbi:MAG: hypothetical protein LBP55_05065 [Candidatus Adiutrix sp.]|jgi:DNA polymerase|nr:hypothetical protein [Candidatus Adiutrix sp.]
MTPAPGADPADFWAEAESLTRALINQLDYFEALGVAGLPWKEWPEPVSSAPAPAAGTLAGLADLTRACRACPGAQAGPPPVPGRGGDRPLVVVVGPTPAMYEAAAGTLLTAMIEKGLKLGPEEYYLTSLIKCQPAEGQAPASGADQRCRPILQRELARLRPKLVLALGRKPGQQLCGLPEPLGALRTRSHTLPGLPGVWLRVTYGLEDMLASPEIKTAVWQDLKKIIPGLAKLRETSGDHAQ